MTHFVFFETPPDVLERTAPLRAELAALQMQWALLKLAHKYRPDQPRVPAGNQGGGEWTYAGGVRLAGGVEDDEPTRARRSPGIEDAPAELRQEDFNNSIRTLRRLEPNNSNLETVTDGSTPGQAVVDAYRNEARAAQLRTANKIASGHAFDEHAEELGVSNRVELSGIVRQVISSPYSQVRDLARVRTGFYDAARKFFVVVNPDDPDGGSIFKTSQKYFNKLEGN